MKHIQRAKRKFCDSTTSTSKQILAIDPGYGRCGWAILQKLKKQNTSIRQAQGGKFKVGEIELIACDCIETSSKHSLPDRLVEITDALEYIIKKYKPTEMAIESLFWFKNKKTAMDVAQARGAIILIAQKSKLAISEYTPLQVKQSVVGYGKATKNQICLMLKAHLKNQCVPIQDDTADAVAIGLTHLQTAKYDYLANPIPQMRPNFPESRPKNKILYPDLSYKVTGLLFDTFNKLGGLLQERYYYSYLKQLLDQEKIYYEFQKSIKIVDNYRYFADFIIEKKIVLELKSAKRFNKKDIDQVMNYLRKTNLDLAILARFGSNGVTTKRILRGY